MSADSASAFERVNGHTLQHLYQRPRPEWDCINCPERHESREAFETVGCGV